MLFTSTYYTEPEMSAEEREKYNQLKKLGLPSPDGLPTELDKHFNIMGFFIRDLVYFEYFPDVERACLYFRTGFHREVDCDGYLLNKLKNHFMEVGEQQPPRDNKRI